MKEKIKYFFYTLATDQNNAFIFRPLKFILLLLSLVYTQSVKFIIFLYQKQFLKPKKVEAVVISVGNITLGGTGKTPLVFYLAEKMQSYNKKAAILTRGYGEDEKFLFQQNLEQIPVLTGKNRIKNARLAIKRDKTEILLLDDAMQQWGIHKNLEVAVVNSVNPFGNNYLLPRGILREPLSGLKRAHIFVISKVDQGIENLAHLRGQLLNLNPRALILETVHQPLSLYDYSTSAILDLSVIKDQEVILISALGDNDYFRYTAEKLDAKVKFHFAFLDHYQYKKDDLLKIFNLSRENKIVYLLTTSKDMVKLKAIIGNNNLTMPEEIKLLVLNVELKILKGEEWLNERLFSLFNS